jgi:hypothetical protein
MVQVPVPAMLFYQPELWKIGVPAGAKFQCTPTPDSSIDFLHKLNRFLKFVADSQFKDVVLIGNFNYPIPNIQWSSTDRVFLS